MTFALVGAVKSIKNVAGKIRRKRMLSEINRDWEREIKTLKNRLAQLGRSL